MPSLVTYLNENAIAVDSQGEQVWIDEYRRKYLDEFFGKNWGRVKYVCIRSTINGRVDDEYRFCYLFQDHSSLLKKDEVAYSAGFISFDTDNKCNKFLKVQKECSMSLGFLGPKEDDEQNLMNLTGFGAKKN